VLVVGIAVGVSHPGLAGQVAGGAVVGVALTGLGSPLATALARQSAES